MDGFPLLKMGYFQDGYHMGIWIPSGQSHEEIPGCSRSKEHFEKHDSWLQPERVRAPQWKTGTSSLEEPHPANKLEIPDAPSTTKGIGSYSSEWKFMEAHSYWKLHPITITIGFLAIGTKSWLAVSTWHDFYFGQLQQNLFQQNL